jgi:hypothetical protein
VLVDDPGCHDGFVDIGQQVYQFVEISVMESKLSITGGECGTIDDRLDCVRVATAYEPP